MSSIIPEKPPKIFISYAWTNEHHIDWVVRFMTQLRENGVNVVMDRTYLRHGNDLNAFMEEMVVDPEFKHVLCICDANYTNKANGRSGGVGTEAQIITPKLYGQRKQEKFIPIIREKDVDGNPTVPVFFASTLGFDFSQDAVYESRFKELMHHIFDRPIYELPPLGTPPAYLYATNRDSHITGSAFQDFKAAIRPLEKSPILAARTYLNALRKAYQGIRMSEDKEVPLLDRLMEAIGSTKSYRNEFIQFVMSWILLEEADVFVREVHRFFEQCASFCYYPVTNEEHLQFFARELFLYFVAIMIREGKSKELDVFLGERYVFERRGEIQRSSYGIFESYLEYLEGATNEKLRQQSQQGRVSVVADILKDRIEDSLVEFEELLQAELVLAMRGTLKESMIEWFPRFLTYSRRLSHAFPFPLFAKAIEPRYLQDMLRIMGFASLDEFLQAVRKAKSSGIFRDLQMREWWGCDFEGMMGIKQLSVI